MLQLPNYHSKGGTSDTLDDLTAKSIDSGKPSTIGGVAIMAADTSTKNLHLTSNYLIVFNLPLLTQSASSRTALE